MGHVARMKGGRLPDKPLQTKKKLQKRGGTSLRCEDCLKIDLGKQKTRTSGRKRPAQDGDGKITAVAIQQGDD